MANEWTAKRRNVNGIDQIQWSVIEEGKRIGIYGVYIVEEGQEPKTEDLVAHTKAFYGPSVIAEYEKEAKEIDDSLPGSK